MNVDLILTAKRFSPVPPMPNSV